MSEEQNNPELLSPPFWGNSDILPFNVDNVEVRTMYCYFPIFTSNGSIIVVDPYEPTKEITIITPSSNEIADRFLAEGDLLAVCAIAKAEGCNETILTEVESLVKAELRKGLELPYNRGELISTENFQLLNEENRDIIESYMTYEDRLGVEPEDINLYLFIHNSTESES